MHGIGFSKPCLQEAGAFPNSAMSRNLNQFAFPNSLEKVVLDEGIYCIRKGWVRGPWLFQPLVLLPFCLNGKGLYAPVDCFLENWLAIIKDCNCLSGTGDISLSRLTCFSPTYPACHPCWSSSVGGHGCLPRHHHAFSGWQHSSK